MWPAAAAHRPPPARAPRVRKTTLDCVVQPTAAFLQFSSPQSHPVRAILCKCGDLRMSIGRQIWLRMPCALAWRAAFVLPLSPPMLGRAIPAVLRSFPFPFINKFQPTEKSWGPWRRGPVWHWPANQTRQARFPLPTAEIASLLLLLPPLLHLASFGRRCGAAGDASAPPMNGAPPGLRLMGSRLPEPVGERVSRVRHWRRARGSSGEPIAGLPCAAGGGGTPRRRWADA